MRERKREKRSSLTECMCVSWEREREQKKCEGLKNDLHIPDSVLHFEHEKQNKMCTLLEINNYMNQKEILHFIAKYLIQIMFLRNFVPNECKKQQFRPKIRSEKWKCKQHAAKAA